MVLASLALVAALAGGWLWTPDLDRATLEARYAQPPSSFIEVDGLRIHVRTSGPEQAPALILMHGFGSSLHTWEAWASDLSQRFRVIRFDLPGAGLTGADPSGDYSDARGLRLINGLMDRLGVSRASLVGHSMGGRLAWRFAAEYPERVDRLVLIAPDGFASPGFEYGKKPDVPASLGLMQYVLPKFLLRQSLAGAFADPQRLTDELVTRYYELVLARSVRPAMLARLEQSILEDPRPMLARIRAPTLLVWGERDAMIPISNAQDYSMALPGARLVALPGVGHVPHEEAPEQSSRAARVFLSE